MSNTPSKRGFAGMNMQQQRAIASKGGRAAHQKGTAHEFSSDEARVAGQRGGLRVSQNRAHMASIGRAGGRMRGQNLRARAEGGAAPTQPPQVARPVSMAQPMG